MNVISLLRKELNWSRHRIRTVVVLFLVVPGIFATRTLFFEHTLPENSPVAVTPEDDSVSSDSLKIVRGSLAFVSNPKIVNDSDDAFRQLSREEVYAVVEVPRGLTDADANVTVDVHVDGSVTIFRLPSRALATVLSETLDEIAPANVDVERPIVGTDTSLSAYLLPTFLMVVVMLVAFTYLPYALASESNIYDRLRVKTSITNVIAAKLLFYTALVVPSILVVYAVGTLYGYPLEPLSVPVVATYLVAFLALGSLSTSIMFLTEFGNLGRIMNVAVFFALVPLSNLAYPAGFFSTLSRSIARANPLHYATIIGRSLLLKDVQVGLFADWLLGLGVWLLGSLVVLRLSITYYTHTQ